MDGRRFGVGLAAGLFLGLAIIVVSGFGASAAAPVVFGGLKLPESSATATNTATSSVTTPPALGSSITSQSQTPESTLSNLNSTAITATNGQVFGPNQKFSSNLASINQLPTASRALLLAPILAAFILGALLYRASTPERGSEED